MMVLSYLFGPTHPPSGDARKVNRRAFVTRLGAVLAAPLFVQAQAPSKIFRIGLLGCCSPNSPEAAGLWAAFLEGLREHGYVEGRNVIIDGRYYGDSLDRLPAFAEELVRVPVDVIVVGGVPAPGRRSVPPQRSRLS